jgi:hypothetical protein
MIVFNQLGNLGRLGNQLFQIAATVSHAKDMSTGALFNKWDYNKYMINPVDDSFTDVNGCFINNQEHDLLHATYHEFRPIPTDNKLILNGFFQSEKYFSKNENLICRTFSPKNEFLQVVKAAGSGFLNQNNLTAVHIRRGDYLEKPNFHTNLKLEYYYDCIDKLLEKVDFNKINIVVFSDDIEWCKANFKYLQCENIYFSHGNSDIVDLYLMAHCKHHIIANSSFSWWGSWLKRMFTDNTGFTFAPAMWFGPDYKGAITDDTYCDGWEINY